MVDSPDTSASAWQHRLARQTGVSLGGKVGGRALHFISEVLLARVLGAAQFGLFSIAWNVLRTIGLIVPLGLDNGLLDAGGRKSKADLARHAGMAAWISLWVGVAAAMAVKAGAPLLADWFQKPASVSLLAGIAFGLPAAAALKVLAAGLRAGGRISAGVVVEEVLPPLGMTAAAVGFLFWGGSAMRAVTAAWGSFALAAVLALLAAARWLGTRFLVFDWLRAPREMADLLRFSLPTALAGMLATLVLLVDRLLVGVFLPATDVGIYQALTLIALIFTTILSAFKVTVSPRVPLLFHQGDRAGLHQLALWSTRWGLYLSIPFFLFLLAAPGATLAVAFGPDFAAGALALVVVAAGQLANVASGPVEFLFIFTGHRNEWLLLSLAAFVLSVCLHLWLIPALGLLGAALALLVTFSMLSLAAAFRVRRHLGFWIVSPALWKGLAAGLLAGVCLWPLAGFNWVASWAGLAGLGLAAVGLFAAFLVLLGLEPEDRALLAELRQRLGRSA